MQVVAVCALAVGKDRAAPAQAHVDAALADGLARAATRYSAPAAMLTEADVAAWAGSHGLPVVTPMAPVGWTAEALGRLPIPLLRLRRDWDSHCWQLATKGFFPFREAIPQLLRQLA